MKMKAKTSNEVIVLPLSHHGNNSPHLLKLTPPQTALLVVDLQERLLSAIHEAAGCMAAAGRMIRAAKVLEVPVVMAEQYPAGLGATCAEIREAAGPSCTAIKKMRFTACVEQTVERLREMQRRAVIVVGIEAHVCVQQTVLDLLRLGFGPFVCADAVSSRRPMDREVALDRMSRAWAVVTTTESVIFELLDRAGTDQFKQILRIVK